MVIITVIIIGVFILAVFARYLGKNATTSSSINSHEWPEGYPKDDPYVTDPTFMSLNENCANHYYRHRWDD